MNVALVHDYLTQRGGAERVVLSLTRAFPDAPLYTSSTATRRRAGCTSPTATSAAGPRRFGCWRGACAGRYQLVIAVRRNGDDVVGHAWVTTDGRPVHESAAAVRDYVQLVEFGPRGLPLRDRAAADELPARWD